MSQQQPTAPQPVPYQPPPVKRAGLPKTAVAVIAGVLGLIVGIVAGAAVVGGGTPTAVPAASKTVSVPGPTVTVTADAPTSEPTSEAPTTSSAWSAKPKDFVIGVKILKKQCFGSAGCNISYRIKPDYVGVDELPTTGTVEVTYKVTGDESGPAENTFTIVDGTASYDKQEEASTPSSSTKLVAKAVSVDYQE